MSRLPSLLLSLSLLAACDPKEDTGVDPVDADGDGFDVSTDCDDDDSAVYPDAAEVCDGVDNNCDDQIDEGVTLAAYADDDGDGYGHIDAPSEVCEITSGLSANADDCDDTDADISPDAAEVCDDIDNNCDGDIDEDAAVDAPVWYADNDSDDYGDDKDTLTQCEAPEGYVELSGDCDDADAAYNPGATEDDCADPSDYNCDGSVAYADADKDGWAACEECDDSDADINPDAEEVCDKIDNDCDGDTDEDDATDASTWYADSDSDGYGDPGAAAVACWEPSGYTSDDTDCDDTDGKQFPGADEYCNREDDDCDGDTDEDDALDANDWYEDADGDGFGDPDSSTAACVLPSGYAEDDTDCDDTDAAVNDDAEEVCDDIDNDCDGDIDDDDTSVDTSTGDTFYTDGDGDGYGDADDSVEACAQPSGTVSDDTDCDDSSADISPDADEVCDSIDNDCDGDIDDDDTSVDTSTGSTFYADADGDGYGDVDASVETCAQPSGYTSDDADCDDSSADISPAADEVCDDVDNDCDGDIDDDDASLDTSTTSTWFIDADGDGYGDSSSSAEACAQPSGYTGDETDCDDTDGSVYPGASGEVYHDDTDQDCDGFDGYTIEDLVEGDLVITEIMPNPSKVNDSYGEYFEFYNASGLQVDLNGLKFSDNASSSTLSSRLVAEAGDYIVFAIDDDVTINGGVDADFDWSGPALANGGDEVVLSYDTTTFDEVDYSTWSYSPSSGVAFSLDPGADDLDNDDEDSWCDAEDTYGDGDYGSPGEENAECSESL